MGIYDIIMRLLCATVMGGIIGLERGISGRPAGFRTHILVAVGAALVMITGIQISTEGGDATRMAAQVISGIGFLGAGTIMHEGITVKGLTTAATLWAVACLGLVFGSGQLVLGAAGFVLVFLSLTVFELLEKKLFASRMEQVNIKIVCTDVARVMPKFSAILKENRAMIKEVNFLREDGKTVVEAWVRPIAKTVKEVNFESLVGLVSTLDSVESVALEVI